MQFQITLSVKNKKYNKLSSVELAMDKLIQLYLVSVGEFSVCMQFNAKKKKKKKIQTDQTLYSVSSAELAQKMVKVKF